IAYAAQDANFDLIEVPVDGSPAKTLLATSRNELEPTWPPRTPEYAFVTDRGGRPEIWRRSRDGSFEQPVVTARVFPEGERENLRMPAFSPDGQQIAFERVMLTGSRIFVASVTGGAPVEMRDLPGSNDAPSWSHDGQWIAFALGTPAGWSLAKVRVGAVTPPVIIRDGIAAFAPPAWSADGRWIACNTPDGLTLVSPDGQSSKVLDEDPWPVYGWAA